MAHRHFTFNVTSYGLFNIMLSHTINHNSVHLSVDSEFLNIKRWQHVNINGILHFFILNSLLAYGRQNWTKLPTMLSIWKSWGKLRSEQILSKCEPLLVWTDPFRMWTTSGNLMICGGKTTEHNHLKPFTGQEILSFI